MIQRDSTKRCGLSRADVLAAIVALTVTFGLTGCFVSKARESANRISCINNLKQIALACHMYADAQPAKIKLPGAGMFALPTEGGGTSVFVTLLPYLEQQTNYETLQKTGKASDVKVYLCPSRRQPPQNGRGDYGYGSSKGGVGISVLDAPQPLTLGEITSKDGTSNTLLMSHKGVNTDQYDGSGKNDSGWYMLDHARSSGTMYPDCPSSERDLSTLIGSPHPNVVPSAWCDGHVSNVPYSTATMPQFWAYNDGSTVIPP